jgi:hypothetical protein
VETYHVGLISLALFGVLGLLALVAWRKRAQKQQMLIQKPVEVEQSSDGSKCFYVATTFADRPLERVIAYGLAHRGSAFLSITETGIEVSRVGEFSFLIPKADLVEIGSATAVIDRAVEKDGLVSIKWRLGSQILETHFRFVDAKLRSSSLSELSTMVGA